MDSFETIALGGVNGLGDKLVAEGKYAIIFDKTGNAGTFFNYSAAYHEMHKEVLKVAKGDQTDDDVGEKMRSHLVHAVGHGTTLVFDFKKVNATVLGKQPAGNVWPADKIFDFAEWRKEDNHMSIVKDGENKDMMGNAGQYVLNPKFNMFILADYQSDEECQALLNIIPHSANMKKYIIQ